jgi:outer membrane protein assembly factor BamB
LSSKELFADFSYGRVFAIFWHGGKGNKNFKEEKMKKLTWSTCLLFIFLFVCLPGSATAGDVNISWPTFQGNAAHTGYVPISLDTEGFELKWERSDLLSPEGETLPLNPVTAAEGKVFVSHDASWGESGTLFALAAKDGSELWKNGFEFVYTLNPPSYADGRVYIQTVQEDDYFGQSFLRAFDTTNNYESAFVSEFESQFYGYYAPTVYDGTLYMIGGDTGSMLYAYNTSAGSMVQQNELLPQYYDEWTPAVNNDYVFAYVGTTLYAMDRNNITETSFSVNVPDIISSAYSMRLAPVIGEQNDILVIQGGCLISFDVQQQGIRWVVDMVDSVESNFNGQPSVAKGVVYAISNGALTAWDEASGGSLWSWQAQGENVTGTMIVTDTHVLVGTASTTYAIDLETHDDIWSYGAAGHLALGNDSLYIASSDGTLTALSIAMAVSSNEPPIADAGPDQVGWGEFVLDGSGSYDPEGDSVSYMWQVKHREDESTDVAFKGNAENVIIIEGESPTLSDLEPGFYDVTVTVTDDDGNSAEDTMLLAVAGKCEGPTQPNAAFDVNRFKIMKYKRWNKRWKWASVSMNGMIDLPDLNLPDKGKVESEITIKLLGVLSNGGDLVLSQENKMRVKNKRRYLHIYR